MEARFTGNVPGTLPPFRYLAQFGLAACRSCSWPVPCWSQAIPGHGCGCAHDARLRRPKTPLQVISTTDCFAWAVKRWIGLKRWL